MKIACYFGWTYRDISETRIDCFVRFIERMQKADKSLQFVFIFQSIRKKEKLKSKFKNIENIEFTHLSEKLDSWSSIYEYIDNIYIQHKFDIILLSHMPIQDTFNIKKVFDKSFVLDRSNLKFNVVKKVATSYLVFAFLLKKYDNLKLFHIVDDPNEGSFKDIFEKNVVELHEYNLINRDVYELEVFSQYFFLDIYKKSLNIEKTFDFTFGCTFLKNKSNLRMLLKDDFLQHIESLKDFNIFYKTKEYSNFIDSSEYMQYIIRSKFSYIIPSYFIKEVSVIRIYECLASKCIPIFHPQNNFDSFFFKKNPDFLNFLKSNELICDFSLIKQKIDEKVQKYDYLIEELKKLKIYHNFTNDDYFNDKIENFIKSHTYFNKT